MANKHRRKTFFENLKPLAHGIGAAIATNKMPEGPQLYDVDEHARRVEAHQAKLARRAERAAKGAKKS